MGGSSCHNKHNSPPQTLLRQRQALNCQAQ
ncbi:MAG: cytochrome c3 family protein [Alphaproteobacteria bacterium]